MKCAALLLLAAGAAAPVLAHTRPSRPPVARGKAPNAPPAKYSPRQCRAYLGGNVPPDGPGRVLLVDWCLEHVRSKADRLLLLDDLYLDTLSDQEQSDHPLAGSKQCEDVVHAYIPEEKASKALGKPVLALKPMSDDDRGKLLGDALGCVRSGNDREATWARDATLDSSFGIASDAGWREGWERGWDRGWDAGIKAQMDIDGKVLRDVTAKDDDRYNGLVKDYNALAAKFHKAALSQPRGFWASLALALASRPASGSPGSLDSTCTEEVGAWPTTFNCGSTTCVREVGAWPATFDCH